MMVSIYTQVYNTKTFLSQCIESVLKQTFTDFEYILIDNGSTDGCKEMLEHYAAQDSRIQLMRFEENRAAPIWLQIAEETTQNRYIAVLDSDDWWEPDYLKSLIGFLEKNRLDLAVTGTINYFEKTKTSRIMRKLDHPVIMSRRQFAEHYPQYWAFPSTNWATIMRTELFRKAELSDVIAANLSNGGDTVSMLKYMELCNRIGIDDTALYHYRIRPKQISRQYNARRFDSNVYYYETIRQFLEHNHAFDAPKQEWLKLVHLTSMTTTMSLLDEADLFPDEKMAECARIATHPLTSAALTNLCAQREQWLQLMWTIISKALREQAFTDTASLHTVLTALCPRCRNSVTRENLSLFTREPELMAALRQDDPDKLAAGLLDLIEAKRYTKQYDLGQILRSLAADRLLLCGIDDMQFLRKYRGIYWAIWKGDRLGALDEMTGMLLEGRVQGGEETFLTLYLSAAAQLEQAPAFIFGKLSLAQLYLRQKRPNDCRAVLDELEEMGLRDDPELTDLYRRLETIT